MIAQQDGQPMLRMGRKTSGQCCKYWGKVTI
jgi:hypothetical protein